MQQVLDHGYVSLVESWGSDERIIEAARMSTNKGFIGWGCDPCPECTSAGRLDGSSFKNDEARNEAQNCACKGTGKTIGDEKLLRYLWENQHSTPFEMAGAVIEVQAPIFVFREWHRHRTQSYNEMSARYTPLPDVNYVPTVERLTINSKTNKQAGTIKGADELTEDNANWFRDRIGAVYAEAQDVYEHALRCGVPKELARIHLPVGRYSRMRASANLRNWLGFLTLRMAPNAQWEIRQFANALHDVLAPLFPRTLALFDEKKQR